MSEQETTTAQAELPESKTISDAIPFEEISQSQDRAWSFRLLQTLKEGADLSEDCLDKLSRTLAALDDPRLLQPLTEMVLDRTLPDVIRRAASDALCDCTSFDTTVETAREREQWWKNGDEIIQRHAVKMAEREEEDLIVSLAENPDHPLHGAAIDKLGFWEEPRFQKLAMAALNHKEPAVRAIAARAVLWEQPVEAERRLLELATETEPRVVMAALETLAYCASLEILLTLNHLCKTTADEEMTAVYKNVFNYVADEFKGCLVDQPWDSEAARNYFENWVQPARELLEREGLLKEQAEEPEKGSTNQINRIEKDDFELDVDWIISDLSEEDGKWLEKTCRYYHIDSFENFSPAERERLLHFLSRHPDPKVRGIAVGACKVWQHNDQMLILLKDRNWVIKRSSVYNCRFLPPDQKLAEELLLILKDKNTSNAMAREAMESYLVHRPESDLRDWLLELALQDERPSVRDNAIRELKLTDAKDHVEKLLPILAEPPCNTWSLHIDVIEACTALKIPIPASYLEPLFSVDNLYLQEALANTLCD